MFKFLIVCVILAPPVSDRERPLTVAMHKEALKHRKAYSLEPQELDKECCQIAQKWADHMAATHSFYHGGGEQIIAVGYATPEAAFRGWMASSGHRYWVLSNVDKCGWGAAKSSTGRWYWAGAFRSSVKVETPTYYVPTRRFRLFRRR